MADVFEISFYKVVKYPLTSANNFLCLNINIIHKGKIKKIIFFYKILSN